MSAVHGPGYAPPNNHIVSSEMKAFRIVLVIGLVLAVAAVFLLPALSRAKIGGGPSCSFNLKVIQSAKEEYAKIFQLTNNAVLTRQQILPYAQLGSGWPRCPKGGEYSIGTLHESPRCSYLQHANLSVPTE